MPACSLVQRISVTRQRQPRAPSILIGFLNSEFKQEIHGLILVTGDSRTTVEGRLADIKKIFLVGEESATIHEVVTLVGDVRPGDEAGHEQFVSRISSQSM
jgi:hypothetical protein